MNQYLFVFTNSYPFGNGYQWLKNELDLIHVHFSQIQLFPYSYEGNQSALSVPANTVVHKPVFAEAPSFNTFSATRLLASPRLPYFIKEFFREKVYTQSYWFKSWYAASQQIEALLETEIYQQLMNWEKKELTTLYFYWGINMSQLVPFLHKLGYKKIVVRFHGFDLYKERLGGYQPYRRPLLQYLSVAAPISEMGKAYLLTNYKDTSFNAVTCRLGTHSKGLSRPSEDGVIRIISCARLIRLKRIDLIADALKKIKDQQIQWTHLGDGEEMKLLKYKTKDLPENIKVNLVGWVNSEEVLNFYVNSEADLFLNVSTTEGVPVSVMEAMSAGIPVLATNVGGTSELVNTTNGVLLPADLNAEELCKAIQSFIELPDPVKIIKREAAYQTYAEMSDFRKLAPDFAALLLNENLIRS